MATRPSSARRMALLLLAMLVPLLLSPGAGRLRCALATGSIECCCATHEPVGADDRAGAKGASAAHECCAVALATEAPAPGTPAPDPEREPEREPGPEPGGDDGPCGCDEHRVDASPTAFDGAAPLPTVLALEAPWSWLPQLGERVLRAGLAPEAAPPDGTGPPLYLRYSVFLI